MIDVDGQLRNELKIAEKHIRTTIEVLEQTEMEERYYIAWGVLAVDAGFVRLRELLRMVITA